MNNIKKILLVTASTLAITSSSIADTVKADSTPVISDLAVKISGYADFQAGLRNQTKLTPEEKNVSKHKKDFAFYNSAALVANVSNKANEVEYGAKIILVPTAKRKASPTYNGSHIYVQSDFGRFEAGSPFSAASTMMIDASDIEAGSGNWDRYAKLNSAHLKQGKEIAPSFATSPEFFLSDKLTTDYSKRAYSNEPSRAISFYTPKFTLGETTKIQAGISYTPDSSNTGADNPSEQTSGISTKIVKVAGAPSVTEIHRFEIDSSVKDTISGSVTLNQHIADGADLSIAVSGEHGKSAGKLKQFTKEADTTPAKKFKLKNLRTYNIGAILNVGNLSYAASFGSLGKSLTSPEFHKTGQKTNYYSGAVAYKQGPFKASVSYYKGEQYKNTTDVVTVGTNYQLAPGFKPYAEIASFKLKGKPEFHKELKSKKKSRGTVALIGAKLSL